MSRISSKNQTDDVVPGSDASCPLTVSELAVWINEALQDQVGYVWVEGEVRDLKTYPSGHTYCSLYDAEATVNLAMFSRIQLPGGIENGTHLLVFGRPEFYAPQGRLSLIAEEVHISGEGELWAKIEKTRQKLAAEGLFDDDRKRPLPLVPKTVGVVCGHEAAVKRDILAATEKRFPGYPITFEEVPVQGDRAVTEIIAALERLGQNPLVDVIILARGGGSLAELAPFYDESLCRAIAASPVPVVSAIGHEKDNPLTDLVADARASTPSRAAMEVIPDEAALRDRISRALDAIFASVERRLQTANAKLAFSDPTRSFRDSFIPKKTLALAAIASVLAEAGPHARLEKQRAKLQKLSVDEAIWARLNTVTAALDKLTTALEALSPESVLQRGFAVVRSAAGEIVRSPQQAPKGTSLHLILAAGVLEAVSRGESHTSRGALHTTPRTANPRGSHETETR